MSTQTAKLEKITGNTFPVKDQLKEMGAKWNAEEKCWMIDSSLADKARAIVSGKKEGGFNRTSTASFTPKKCVACGAKAQRDSRGYPIVKIYRSGECQDCYEERKMGY